MAELLDSQLADEQKAMFFLRSFEKSFQLCAVQFHVLSAKTEKSFSASIFFCILSSDVAQDNFFIYSSVQNFFPTQQFRKFFATPFSQLT